MRSLRQTNNSFQSYLLVTIQFLCLGGLVITGPLLASGAIALGLELLGFALGVWAIVTMKLPNLNILPDIRAGSRLVTHGPYRYIRHPMYTALLLVTLALVLDAFSLKRLILWITLAIDLWVKLVYEERLLARHFGNYEDYRQRTKRILPFLL